MNWRLHDYCLRLQIDLEDSQRYMERHLASARTRRDPSEDITLMAESYKNWYAYERASALTLLAVLPRSTGWETHRKTLTVLVRRVDALYIRFWEGR